MGSLSPEERPAFGQRANEVRAQIEAEIERRQTEMKSAMRDRALRAEKLDVTVPGEDVPFGHIHPLSRVQHEIEDIFIGMGYSIAEGPEVELDYYNFQALQHSPGASGTRYAGHLLYNGQRAASLADLPRSGSCNGEGAPADPHPLPRTCVPLRRG